MPTPNYLVNTSPDHWQVSWKVQGFGKKHAEEMMRTMVREFGADRAATDVSRVLRVPGFANHKRSGHMVRMEQLSATIYRPEHFPRFAQEDRRNEEGGVRSDHSWRVSRSHLQMLANEIPGLLPVNPQGGKIARAAAFSPLVEAGNVYLLHPDCVG